MVEEKQISVAGILSEIAGGFPATEVAIDTDPFNQVQLVLASTRRVALVISNTSVNDQIITTNPGNGTANGWIVKAMSVEKFLVKDYGGLVMMPWWIQPDGKFVVTMSVFETYSARG